MAADRGLRQMDRLSGFGKALIFNHFAKYVELPQIH
jgi:hypothetical protein